MYHHLSAWSLHPTAASRRGSRQFALPRWLVLVAVLVANLVWPLAAPRRATAQDAANPAVVAPLRLFDRLPYDVVVLNDTNRTRIEVQPIPFIDRKLPVNPRPSETITVSRLDHPGQDYEIAWRSIAEVLLFEQMVLNKANELVTAGNFDEAFEYFNWLELNEPNLAGLPASVERFLYEEAKHWQREQKYENALILLHELHARHPQREGLAVALGAATGKLIEARVNDENFGSARRLLAGLLERFPENSVAAQWTEKLTSLAQQHLTAAQELAARGEYRAAQAECNRTLEIAPTLPGAHEFANEVFQKFPRLTIGVIQPARPNVRASLAYLPGRRIERLRQRSLLEFTGVGEQGGTYQSPFGTFERTDLGQRIEFHLRVPLRKSAGDSTLSTASQPALTGYDVAQRLLSLADPAQEDHEPAWTDLMAGVTVRDVYTVNVELNRAHVQPAGLLQVAPALNNRALAPAWTPFSITEETTSDLTFLATAGGTTLPGQIMEITERHYTDPGAALRDLSLGRISAIERVAPWELEKYQAASNVRVAKYALPTLHCILPNMNKPWPANRSYRRAVLYGINRELTLARQVLRGKTVEDCVVISGPFPRGVTFDDPLGFAYNPDVAARPYEPRLAMTLAGVAQQEVTGKKAPTDLTQPAPPLPTLVLAHPATRLAKGTCEIIQKQLAAVGIPLQLKELAPGAPPEFSDEIDLLYAEIQVQDPVVDARRLLGPDGVLGQCSAYMRLALRQLDAADDWNTVRAKLRQIHRLAADEVAIIPLWQVPEYFAHHVHLNGIGNAPVTLYQNVDQWRGAYLAPEEVP